MRLSVLFVLLAAGCSSSSTRSPFADTPAPAASTSSSSSGSGGFAPTDAGGVATDDGCNEASKVPYVISSSFDLISFTPNTGTFAPIGHIDCEDTTAGSTPNSMAVDRSGTAWVNFSSGSVFKVSIKDATCEKTAYKKQGGFIRFGMGFASDTAGSENETLFISGTGETLLSVKGFGLFSLDRQTLKLAELGDYSGKLKEKPAELTGRGDGKLFGFFTTEPATLAEIDKATGATSNEKVLTGVTTGEAYAFSFWGGDFWFYTVALGAKASTVTRLAASGDGAITKVKTNADEIAKSNADGTFKIVGAGVSTCAPLEPPK